MNRGRGRVIKARGGGAEAMEDTMHYVYIQT